MKVTKEAVFNQAQVLVHEKGLANLTIRELAKASNVSIGTIYNMFDTKDNLVLMLIDNYWCEAIQIIFDEVNQDQNFIDQLIIIYTRYLNISRNFHEDWIHDIDGLSMTSKDMRDLNQKYRSLVTKEVLQRLNKTSLIEDPILTHAKLAETIHIISIKTDFSDENEVVYYRSLIKRLINKKQSKPS